METETSPYHPPQAEVRDATDPGAFELASTGQRLANYVLDTVCLYVVGFAGGALLIALLLVLGADAAVEAFSAEGSPLGFLVGIVLSLVYYTTLEALFGRTPGKLVTRTRAVNADDSRLTVGRALGRSLSRLIPFEAFSFLGGAGRPRGWHDSIPGTKVVALTRPRRRGDGSAPVAEPPPPAAEERERTEFDALVGLFRRRPTKADDD